MSWQCLTKDPCMLEGETYWKPRHRCVIDSAETEVTYLNPGFRLYLAVSLASYKGGKGAFPKLLMPADVDGDGYVSDLDVAKVQFCINHGIYDPLCDINMDGVIDQTDVDLVKENLGRGTPVSGVVWTPTISSEVEVEVT